MIEFSSFFMCAIKAVLSFHRKLNLAWFSGHDCLIKRMMDFFSSKQSRWIVIEHKENLKNLSLMFYQISWHHNTD